MPSASRRRSSYAARAHSVSAAVIAALLSLAGVVSVQTPATADPAPPTACSSCQATGNSPAAPVDAMGPPSASTLQAADQLLVNRVYGTSSSYIRHDLTSGGAGTQTAPAAIASRADLSPQFPTSAGHFIDSDAERSLQLRQLATGGPSLFQLDSPSYVNEPSWAVSPSSPSATALTAGSTYVFADRAAKASLTEPLGTVAYFQANITDSGPGAGGDYASTQQWTTVVVPGYPDGYFELVNRADGLCLDATNAVGAHIVSYPCDGQASQQWRTDSATGALVNNLLVGGSPAYIGPGNGSGVLVTVAPTTALHFTLIPVAEQSTTGAAVEPIPTWSMSFGDTPDKTMPFDMTTGDLDRVADTNGNYHDEAVVATDHAGQLEVRVIDYNANPSRLLVTDTGDTLAQIPTSTTGGLGAINVAVGDFDGDGHNEIALLYQNRDPAANNQFLYQILRYTASGSTRKLSVVGNPQPVPNTANANTGFTTGLTRMTGSSDTAVGNFTGAGPLSATSQPMFSSADQLALTFLNSQGDPCLQIVTFDSTFAVNDSTAIVVADDKFTAGGITGGLYGAGTAEWTFRGPRVVAGLFINDHDTYGVDRRELAVAYSSLNGTGDGDAINSDVAMYAVDTALDSPHQPDVIDLSWISSAAYGASLYYSPPPLNLVAGGFGGVDPATATIPLWSVALSEVIRSGSGGWNEIPAVLTPVPDPGSARLATLTITQLTQDVSPVELGSTVVTAALSFTSFDHDNTSIRLGAPFVTTISNLQTVKAIAAQPPTHADWNGTGFTDVSRFNNFTVSTSSSNGITYTSSTTTSPSHSVSVSGGVNIKATYAAGVTGILEVKGSADLDLKTSATWSTHRDFLNGYSHTVTTNLQQTGTDDDAIVYTVQSSTDYRYPILGTSGTTTCDAAGNGTCHAFEDVMIPGSITQVSGFGKNIAAYQPNYENGNALSYPTITADNAQANNVPAGAASLDLNGLKTAAGSNVLLQTTNQASGGGTSAVTLSTSGNSTTTNTATTTTDHTFNEALELSASLDAAGNGGSITGNQGFDYDKTFGTTTASSTVTSVGNDFTMTLDSIDAQAAYKIGTNFFFDTSGAANISQGDDLSSNGTNDYWQSTYGQSPDPALLEPDSASPVVGATSLTYPTPEWNPYPSRQLIRGFRTVHTASGGTNGNVTYSTNPQPGDTADFAVGLHNLSLKASPAGQWNAHFYAVQTSDSAQFGPDSGTAPVDLGTSPVPAMSAQGSTQILSPTWTAPKGSPGATQDYRIFVRLEPTTASVAEIHPLTGGAPCPSNTIDTTLLGQNSTVLADGLLRDPMTGQQENLACGQNNQGFGTVSVTTPQTGLGAAKSTTMHSTSATIGNGLLGGTQKNSAGVAQLTQNREVQGALHAGAAAPSAEHRIVLVFDGRPDKGGQLIAQTTMNGAGSTHDTLASYSWNPNTIGKHTLYLELLPGTPGEKMEVRTQRVNVAAATTLTSPALPSTSPATPPTSPPAPPAHPSGTTPAQPATTPARTPRSNAAHPSTTRPALAPAPRTTPPHPSTTPPPHTPKPSPVEPQTHPLQRSPLQPTSAADAAASTALAFTGAQRLGAILAVGAALCVVGGVLAWASRRRRSVGRHG